MRGWKRLGGKSLVIPSATTLVDIPLGQLPDNFKLSGRVYLDKIVAGKGSGSVLALATSQAGAYIMGLAIHKYPTPLAPEVRIGGDIVLTPANLEKLVHLGRWQKWEFTLRGDRAQVMLDGQTIYDDVLKNPAAVRNRLKAARLQLGSVPSWIDDVVVTALPKEN